MLLDQSNVIMCQSWFQSQGKRPYPNVGAKIVTGINEFNGLILIPNVFPETFKTIILPGKWLISLHCDVNLFNDATTFLTEMGKECSRLMGNINSSNKEKYEV